MEELIYKTAGVWDNLDRGFLEKIHNHAPGVVVGHLSTLLKNQRLREIYEKVLETPIKTFNKPEEVELEGGSPLKWQGGYGLSHGGSMIFINPAISVTDIVRTLFEEGAHAIWAAEGRPSKPFDPAHPPTEEEYLSDPEEIFAKRMAERAFAIATGKIKTAAWAEATDFSSDPQWHDVFYQNPSPERIKALASFLRSDPNRFITLYHGTASSLPVMEEGLLPTSPGRAKSYQTSPGYVYLSVYPGNAKNFGELAYPGEDITVYAVNVTARRLLPDTDQLANQRSVGKEVGDSLAESLAIGHGARVKGAIGPMQLYKAAAKKLRLAPDIMDGTRSFLWAIVNDRVIFSLEIEPHVRWFERVGLPDSGKEFDRIPRGRVWVQPQDDEVILFTEAGRGGITGRADFTFAPEYLVEAVLQTFPQLRDFNIVDNIPSDLVVTSSVHKKGTIDPKKGTAPKRWSHPLLNGLKAEARKAPTFEDFKHDFSIDIKHGLYFHVTDNPNFTIDPAKGPRDMSSMGGGTPVPGKLMVTSHLENWTDYYENDRAYVAVIDMSEVPRESYHQVSRGFGNEFWVENPQAAKVSAVMPVKEAIKLDRTYQNVLDLHADEDLLEFYNQFHAPVEPEWKPPKEQGKLPFRGKGIAVASIMNIQSLYPPTPEWVDKAKSFLIEKWKERAKEYGRSEPNDLEGACKFSSLFTQALFGGKLRGNWEHQFVVLPDDTSLDLTGRGNTLHDAGFFGNPEHQESMESCRPRVTRWVEEFRQRYPLPIKQVASYEPYDFELLWATWHNKVLLTDDMGLWHVKWFQELNQHSQRHDPIPSWGPEFDKVPRGRAEVNKKKKRVRLYTDAAPKGSRAGESITGEADFDFTPEEVVAKIKQKYPSLRDFEFVDEVAPRLRGKWAADEFEYPQIAYHVSRRRSRNSILKNGLQMYHKQQYEDVEHEPAVYLFGSLSDAENWVGEQQSYTGQACDIWEVKVPQGEGTFWPDFEVRHEYPTAWKYLWDIPPQNLKLIKTIALPKQAAVPTGKAIDDLGISGQQGWSYDEPFPDRHNDFYEDDQVQNPHSERPLTAALSPVYTEEVKKLEYEHELVSLAEEMGNFERVVWERQPVLKTHTLDTVGLAGSANDYPHLRAVHVGDPDYWFSRLTEDYSRNSTAWVVEIYPTEDDYLCDDVQYTMDPSGGDKAYSAILITPRTQLVEGKDFRYVKELTEEDLPEVYDEDDGFGFKDAAVPKTVIMWIRYEGKIQSTVQIGNKSHAQWLEELSLPFAGPSYDRIERGVAIVDRTHRLVHLVKNAGGYTPNDVVEHIKNRYGLGEFSFIDTESFDSNMNASQKTASDDAYYDAAEAFFDRESVVAVEVITEYMQHVRQKRYRQQWNVVPAARLIKIWEDYMKTGFVRDSAGLNQIAETVIDNCLKIYVNSILCGHSAMGPEEYASEMLEREGISKKFPEDYFERAPDYFDTPEGGWRISDQAEGRLMNLVQGVYLAKSDEDKLQALDKVLQFSHPRSDLSSWLVQGGRTTLNRLFTGMNEYERWEQYGGVEEAKELNKEFNKGRNALLIPKEAWSTEPGGEPLKPETQSTIAEMVADIRKIYPECQRISLAGSAARDELKPKSDIDVVIDFPKGTPAWDMVERDQPLWDKYQQVEGRMVDFIIHVEGGPHVGQYDYREELGLPNPMKALWEATTKTAAPLTIFDHVRHPSQLPTVEEFHRVYPSKSVRYAEIRAFLNTLTEPLVIYRAVKMHNRYPYTRGFGIYWTYDETAAVPYNADYETAAGAGVWDPDEAEEYKEYNKGRKTYIFRGEVTFDAVDWGQTVWALRGQPEEKEITLHHDAPVHVTGWKRRGSSRWLKPKYEHITAARRPKYRTYVPDTRTFSEAFMKWFDGSRVVNPYGKPLLVYHGSPDTRWLKEEGVFQTPTERFLHKEDPERAFWFAADYSTASSYADPHRAWDYQGCEPGTKGFYLSIKNPYVVDKGGASWHGTDTTVAEAKAGGHDGIIIHNTVDTYQAKGRKTDTYAVFSPNQIKAADNTICDPVSPNVNASLEKEASKAMPPITESSWITSKGKVIPNAGSTHARNAVAYGLCDKEEPQNMQEAIRACMQAMHRGNIRVIITDNGVTFQSRHTTPRTYTLIRSALASLTKPYPVYEIEDDDHDLLTFSDIEEFDKWLGNVKPYGYGKAAAQRSIWYHGSSPSNLRSILTEGLNPRPKKRNWGDDPNAGAYSPSRESYGGVYVTQNLTTAMSSPRQRGNEHGVIVVCMDLQPNTMYLDEDSVTGYLQQALPSISDMGNSYYILPAYLAVTYPERAKGWGEYVDDERKKYIYKALRGLRFKYYGTNNDEFNGDFHPEVQKRLLEILPECFFAALARSAAHHAKKEQDWELSRTYQRAFAEESGKSSIPPAEEIRKLFPSPEEGERMFRDAVAKVTIALKRYANPKEPNAVYNFNNARIEMPIGYGGSNRILAVIEVREKYHLEKVEGKRLPTELIVHYGEIPPDFLAQFNTRYGENYVVKPAESVSKTADVYKVSDSEDKPIKEPWQLTKEEFIANPPAGFEYVPGRPFDARRQGPGLTRVSDTFFEGNEDSRRMVVNHEIGHDLMVNFNRDFRDVLAPFREDGKPPNAPMDARTTFDNFFGGQHRPEEVIADTYAALFEGGAKWYIESPRCVNLVNRVIEIARRMGKPLPPEMGGKTAASTGIPTFRQFVEELGGPDTFTNRLKIEFGVDDTNEEEDLTISPEEAQKRFAASHKFFLSQKWPLDVYRAVSLPADKPWSGIKQEDFGVYWSMSSGTPGHDVGAYPYGSPSRNYRVFHAKVRIEDVDWFATLALSMSGSFNDEEEIRLKDGVQLTLDKWRDMKDQWHALQLPVTASLPGLGLLQPGHGDDSSVFDPGYYMTEGCGIFAVALARLNQGVVYFMSDPEGDPWHDIGEMSPEQIAELEDSGNLVDWNMTHVYCMALDGKTYDIKGQRSPAVMAKDFDMDPANPEVSLDGGPYQPDDFMNQFMGEMPESGGGERPLYGNEKDVAEVTQYILKNPRKYGLTRKGH